MTIHAKLKQRAKEKGVTISELAKVTGVSRQAMSRFLNGHTDPRYKQFLRICVRLELGVSLIELPPPPDEITHANNP